MQFIRPATTGLQHLHSVAVFCAALLLPCFAPSCQGGGLVRLSDGTEQFEGKVIALTQSTCSLMDRQGRLLQLPVRDLKSFEKISPRFSPYSTAEMRNILRAEFGSNYEVTSTTHYLVCAPVGTAARYAALFEQIYRDVEKFFRVRGFRLQRPDMPLVAVVFGTQQEFHQYCLQDHVPPSSGLMGYYSLITNRVVLFDDHKLTSQNRNAASWTSPNIAATTGIANDTADTIIHETTHQVSYNIGIHSRLGGTPAWVAEGLATVLEPDGMRHQSSRSQVHERLNTERLQWFRTRHLPTRSTGNLAKLIASDDHFHRNTLDSYSESCAVMFFLLENGARRQKLVEYLHILNSRDSTKPYPPKERLADFQKAFGDISRLEVDFLRFIDRL